MQQVEWIHKMSRVPHKLGLDAVPGLVNSISWSTKSARTRSAVGSNNNFAWVGFLRSSHSVRMVLGLSKTVLPGSFTLCEGQFLQSALNSDFLIVLKSESKQRLLSWQCLQAADDARVCCSDLISASRILTFDNSNWISELPLSDRTSVNQWENAKIHLPLDLVVHHLLLLDLPYWCRWHRLHCQPVWGRPGWGTAILLVSD